MLRACCAFGKLLVSCYGGDELYTWGSGRTGAGPTSSKSHIVWLYDSRVGTSSLSSFKRDENHNEKRQDAMRAPEHPTQSVG